MEVKELHSIRLNKANGEFFKNYMPPDLYNRLGLPTVLALGAVEDNTSIGVVFSEVQSNIVCVPWIFTSAVNRRRGVASMLLRDLAEQSKPHKYQEIRIAFSQQYGDEGMFALAEKCGYSLATADGGMFNTRLVDFDWEKLTVKPTPQIIKLKDTQNHLFYAFSKSLNVNINVDLPLLKADYLPYSTVYIQDGKICGVCLFKHINEKMVEMCLLHSFVKDSSVISAMFKIALDGVRKNYPDDTVVTMTALQEKQARIFYKLANRTEKAKIFLAWLDLSQEKEG